MRSSRMLFMGMGVVFFVGLTPSLGQAKDLDVPARVRLNLGSTQVDPKDLNEEFEAQGLKKIKTLNHYGFEGTYPFAKFFEAGFRYSRKIQTSDEDPENPAASYQAELKQDTLAAIARVPIVKTNLLRVEAFGGAGGANTKIKIRTASQDGELQRMQSDKAGSSLYTVYGATLAIGWKRVYFMVEGGIEGNSFGSLSRTGTVNGNIETIDLNGSFFTVGFLLDGLASKK